MEKEIQEYLSRKIFFKYLTWQKIMSCGIDVFSPDISDDLLMRIKS